MPLVTLVYMGILYIVKVSLQAIHPDKDMVECIKAFLQAESCQSNRPNIALFLGNLPDLGDSRVNLALVASSAELLKLQRTPRSRGENAHMHKA